MGDTLCAVLTDSIYSGNCIGSCHDLRIILRESRPFFRLSKRHLSSPSRLLLLVLVQEMFPAQKHSTYREGGVSLSFHFRVIVYSYKDCFHSIFEKSSLNWVNENI